MDKMQRDDESVHERVVQQLRETIDEVREVTEVSPTFIATKAANFFADGDDVEVHLMYASVEHFKQLARELLRQHFSPHALAEAAAVGQGDMFRAELQERYPVRVPKGSDPIYKRREFMTLAELDWVIAKMQRAASGLLHHVDMLRVYREQRALETAAA
jgi:hypothetical protein